LIYSARYFDTLFVSRRRSATRAADAADAFSTPRDFLIFTFILRCAAPPADVARRVRPLIVVPRCRRLRHAACPPAPTLRRLLPLT